MPGSVTVIVEDAFLVPSRMLVATAWKVPMICPVTTPLGLMARPLPPSWTDQVTPAVLAAPVTVAVNAVVPPSLTDADAGETATSENREMTMKPLSWDVVQTSPLVAFRSFGKLGLDVDQSNCRT